MADREVASAPVLYIGMARCLDRIPVPPRQKVALHSGRLRSIRGVNIVQVCPGEWGRMTPDLVRSLRILEVTGSAEVRVVDCIDERYRLLALLSAPSPGGRDG
jgi:hypothetical protein